VPVVKILTESYNIQDSYKEPKEPGASMTSTVIVAIIGILGTLGAGVGAPFVTYLLQDRRAAEDRERERLQTRRERLETLYADLLKAAAVLLSAMQDIEISSWPKAVADIETRYKDDLRSSADGYAAVMPCLEVLPNTSDVLEAANKIWRMSETVTFPLYKAADTGVMPSDEVRARIRPMFKAYEDLVVAIKGNLLALEYLEYGARPLLRNRQKRLQQILQGSDRQQLHGDIGWRPRVGAPPNRDT